MAFYAYGDFDLAISEIFLAHRCLYPSKYRCSAYKNGRHMSGFVYCQSGKAQFDFLDEKLILQPGDLLFLPACCHYQSKTVGDKPFLHMTVNFSLVPKQVPDGSVIRKILDGEVFYTPKQATYTAFKSLMERLVQLWSTKQEGYRVLSQSVLYELLYLYFTDAAKTFGDAGDYARIQPAKQNLDEQYMDNTSMNELAALCGLSPTHFRRLFLRLFGCPPMKYRLNKRILKAKDLLLSGDFNVSETAEAVGFDDPNYFSRIFKTYAGCSPSAFLKSNFQTPIHTVSDPISRQ